MSYFDKFLAKHDRWQQDRFEIETVAKIIGPIKTYLEIGTAEGGSLYYFAHHLAPVRALCVDLDEPHTRACREWVRSEIGDAVDVSVISGNSMDEAVIDATHLLLPEGADVVFIDGGHDYATVKSDWLNYGCLAKRFVVFHDICLPDVKKLWDEIEGRKLSIIERGRFGMGIICLQ